MKLQQVIAALEQTSGFQQTLKQLQAGNNVSLNAPASSASLIAGVFQQLELPLLVITPSDKQVDDVADSLQDFYEASDIATFPAWETLPHERLSPSSETIGKRIATLHRIAHPDKYPPIKVLVLSVRSFIQPLIQGIGDIDPLSVTVGDEISHDALVAKLIEFGFERVDIIERRGQFAVRGGIVDVFVPTDDHPIRVEFWGDTVEDIRSFSVADQRSLGLPPTQLTANLCREFMINEDVRKKAKQAIEKFPEISDLLEQLAEGSTFEGVESLTHLLDVPTQPFIELLQGKWLALEVEPERIHSRVDEILSTSQEFFNAAWSNAAHGNDAPIMSNSGFLDYGATKSKSTNFTWCSVSILRSPDALDVGLEPSPEYRSKVSEFVHDIKRWQQSDQHVVISMNSLGSATRLSNVLSEWNIPSRITDSPQCQDAIVEIVVGHQLHGGIASEAGLAFVTEFEIFRTKDTERSQRHLPSKRRSTIDPLTLISGDYIVHDQHGVGRYLEMVSRTSQGVQREYLVIEYAPSKRGQRGDRVYVPTDQLDHITRYVGGEAPSLNKLGGSDWAATQSRARKAVRQIADELIRLYAQRLASKGYAFSPDSPWQRELEDSFEFVETPDQLSTINEVKADMEREIPMDRLVCGDVGYGKTEIAVRAAFKAVQDGKQVAILVPTTLLVAQHFETFSRRYAQFPVRLAALSRFQTEKEVKEVLDGLSDGSVDIVIGTHRLFSADVRFKDLGLVIVDEEQRFGVEHKEHLKALRTNVDMLTMSATPIPRTLEMAVTGIREMSTIQTPPEERLPVLTTVGPYDEKYIVAAIHRELLRDGQVFFVHNRVASIYRVASKLSELLPDARIGVAHGQMNEHELEQVIVDFWEHKLDVLVSTTIIESGLDIPNANTLIVDRAETFGLAQLHQLRGRVGRSRERGYAYFLYQPERPLSQTAYDRLATIAAHTDLGAGMAVAMKDLEIRGAGNLLGGEQSGHIAEIGFDLYVRMVNEAIEEVRHGGNQKSVPVIKVELPVEALIPHDYVPQERLRLEAYQRLADAHTHESVDELVTEFIDRYGPMPEPVRRLVDIAKLRVLMLQVGLTDAIVAGSSLKLSSVEMSESKQMRLSRLYPGSRIQAATRTIVVPLPVEKKIGLSAQEHTSVDVTAWVTKLVTDLFLTG